MLKGIAALMLPVVALAAGGGAPGEPVPDATVLAEPDLARGSLQCNRIADDDVRALALASPAIALAEYGAAGVPPEPPVAADGSVPPPHPMALLPMQVALAPRGDGIAADSAAQLAQLVPQLMNMLGADPALELQLVGHARGAGRPALQAALARARLVRAYLLARGLPFARVQVAAASGGGGVEVRAATR